MCTIVHLNEAFTAGLAKQCLRVTCFEVNAILIFQLSGKEMYFGLLKKLDMKLPCDKSPAAFCCGPSWI